MAWVQMVRCIDCKHLGRKWDTCAKENRVCRGITREYQGCPSFKRLWWKVWANKGGSSNGINKNADDAKGWTLTLELLEKSLDSAGIGRAPVSGIPVTDELLKQINAKNISYREANNGS